MTNFALGYRTAAFATHIPAIREMMLHQTPQELPWGFAPELSPSLAVKLAERLRIKERICGCTADVRVRPTRKYFFCRMALVKEEDAAFIDLGLGLYVPVPELIFMQMASELDFAGLVRFGYDLCGTYAPGHGGVETEYDLEPLTTVARLEAFCLAHAGACNATKALRALAYVLDGSASPKESILAMRFVLARHYGGYGAAKPVMNVTFNESRGDRFPDLFWGEYGIDMEYDSDEFHDEKTRDAIRRNQLQHELRVLTVTEEIMASPKLMDRLAEDFFKAARVRFRCSVKGYAKKKRQLHAALSAPEWYKQWGAGVYCQR